MSKAVEQALTGLIPSWNSSLPSELVDSAVSLLAQSRNKASSLKPDEEIARTYACANLACERLKQRLNLPQIVLRPPVPPRIYRKVYNYFDTALAVRAPQTPSKRGRGAESATATPVKRTPAATSSKATPRHKALPAKRNEDANREDAPEWVMPMIRQVCKGLEAPAAPPHVYAGVCSVLKLQNGTTPSRTRTRRTSGSTASAEAVTESQIPALIVALLVCTMIRLSGNTTTGDENEQRKSKAVSILQENDICKDQAEDDLEELIEHFLGVATKGWLELEWFQNIVQGSGLDNSIHTNGSEEEVGESNVESSRPSRPATTTPKRRRAASQTLKSKPVLMQSGLGTMFQEKVDYLSDTRRLDFLDWKEHIMARIEQIEEQQRANGSAMDVSAG
ncbi:uncharacterized protein K452DRAFT_315880 [Aplosporella prunicola CBS 121167]|uniref:ORC6 first cyclin-like domain-containing protein n=1 Tax=Aplosporella prunicola CBS 121167 TaxID=1176127 RepID=A0A6A6BNI6_9PEZI|nr:uncharacterized protein K452DRAFT_315880 [Aplosporella prunicola CBS 121167]KAF2145690.1 hypothetical protein K452DRAFT_315880 [Aplosporella prunicola CBS 121167]